MTRIDFVEVAFDSLRINRLRSALTMLGVIIGVAAVILLVALGQGTKNYVEEQFAGLGSNILGVTPAFQDVRNLHVEIGSFLGEADVDARRRVCVLGRTVKERTNEIGIRKAVGARNRDILLQFLLESTALAVAGGTAGILAGVAFAWELRIFVPRLPVSVPAWSVFLSFTFSAFVGVFFGVYPAKKAASLNPIEALRYE